MKKLKIAFVQNQRMPNEYAIGIYVVKTCVALSSLGYPTSLYFPQKTQHLEFLHNDLWKYYTIPKNYFKIKIISIPELLNLPKYIEKIFRHFRSLIQTWIFAIRVIKDLSKENIEVLQTYCKEVILLTKIISNYHPHIIYEVHTAPMGLYEKLLDRIIYRIPSKILTINKFHARYYLNKGIASNNIITLPCGFDGELFNVNNKYPTKKELQVPQNRLIIGFIGRFENFGSEKGVETILKAVAILRKNINICAICIGGPLDLVKKYKRISNELRLTENEAIILDAVLPSQVPNYIKTFDIACMLYPDSHHYRDKMSPQKMIEYMAMKKIIIASDLPSIREVLNKDNSYLIDPENHSKLAETIIHIYQNKKDALVKALNAYEYVQKYEWKERQSTILKKLNIL